MNWITTLCSMIAASCLTVASVHLLVWLRSRDASQNLLLANCALSAGVVVVANVALMHAETPEQFGVILRWTHVPLAWALASALFFARHYLEAGRTWLIWSAIGTRAISLVVNFVVPVNLNFREITTLEPRTILGERLMVPVGVSNQWALLGNASVALFLAFLVDAAVTGWRNGRRLRALLIGGVLAPATLAALIRSMMFVWGGTTIRTPYFVSIAPVAVLAVMSFALSGDLLRSAQLERDLRDSRERMSLAAAAAQLGFWEWDVARDEVWATGDARVSFSQFLDSLHPDDREATDRVLRTALAGDNEYSTEYRVPTALGGTRRIAARGRVARDGKNAPLRVRGVAVDVTDRRRAEQALREAHAELDRVSRLTAMGEFAAALAHEILQPLSAIVLNAKTCLDTLPENAPAFEDVRGGLRGVVEAGERAVEIIRRNRELFRHQTVRTAPLNINAVIAEARVLAGARLIDSGVTVAMTLADRLRTVSGDRVELQQVLLNLISNAIDATESKTPRRIWIRSSDDNGGVRVEVGDNGIGFSHVDMDRMFSLSYTTKANGTGVGLSISRAIVDAHGGRIWAEANREGGATFSFTLPRVATARDQASRELPTSDPRDVAGTPVPAKS